MLFPQEIIDMIFDIFFEKAEITLSTRDFLRDARNVRLVSVRCLEQYRRLMYSELIFSKKFYFKLSGVSVNYLPFLDLMNWSAENGLEFNLFQHVKDIKFGYATLDDSIFLKFPLHLRSFTLYNNFVTNNSSLKNLQKAVKSLESYRFGHCYSLKLFNNFELSTRNTIKHITIDTTQNLQSILHTLNTLESIDTLEILNFDPHEDFKSLTLTLKKLVIAAIPYKRFDLTTLQNCVKEIKMIKIIAFRHLDLNDLYIYAKTLEIVKIYQSSEHIHLTYKNYNMLLTQVLELPSLMNLKIEKNHTFNSRGKETITLDFWFKNGKLYKILINFAYPLCEPVGFRDFIDSLYKYFRKNEPNPFLEILFGGLDVLFVISGDCNRFQYRNENCCLL